MKIATAWSTSENTRQAVTEAFVELINQFSGFPTWIAVHATYKHDGQTIIDTLNRLAPEIPIHGGTSCLAVMTDEGFHHDSGISLGLLGILDPQGAYGTAGLEIGLNPRAAGVTAARQAIIDAERRGEQPRLAWLTCAPGFEEDILAGIEEVVGKDVPIVGGSAADDEINGNWNEFMTGKVLQNGLVLTVMYPTTRVGVAFSSGYFATSRSGLVTDATKRTVHTIDNRPAAEVYNEWTGGVIKENLHGGNILAKTSFNPLGRVVKTNGTLNYYQLSHPDAVDREGGLLLFSDVKAGEKLILMRGTKLGLVNRAGTVIESAVLSLGAKSNPVAGGLVIFCAGCMMAIQDEMKTVVSHLRASMSYTPFLGVFTFGEQGCISNGLNRHGNLMISAIVFEGD